MFVDLKLIKPYLPSKNIKNLSFSPVHTVKDMFQGFCKNRILRFDLIAPITE